MDNVNINLLVPNTSEIKSDTKSIKKSTSNLKEDENQFDKALKNATPQAHKKAKSVVNEKVQNIKISKSLDRSVLTTEEENQEAVDQTILSLISTVLQIPIEEVNKILEQMDIQPTDLLEQGNFKAFLDVVYGGVGEEVLLFNEDKLKDISKLFMQLEQISEVVQSGEGQFLVEQLVSEEEVITTHVTQLDTQGAAKRSLEEGTAMPTAEITVQATTQSSVVNLQETLKDSLKKEDSTLLSEVGTEGSSLDVKDLGLGMSIPIQAFNSAMHTKMWENNITKAEVNYTAEAMPLMNQMIDKIEIASLRNYQEITMQLSPKELGHLSIKLTETNGTLVADIKVDNDKAKELILSEVDKLRQTLQEQGLSVGDVRVDVRQNSHQSQMEQQKQKSTKRIQELVQKHFYEDEIEEVEAIERPTETEIDYMV